LNEVDFLGLLVDLDLMQESALFFPAWLKNSCGLAGVEFQ
jgi:hypothetical protein